MPLVQTRDFGEFSYDPAAVLSFPCGIPGFDDHRSFILIEDAAIAPVVVLQSVNPAPVGESPALSFLTVPVAIVEPGYQSGIAPEDLRILGLDETRQPLPGQEALYLAILSSTAGGRFTANLLAPVVVNSRTGAAVQAVRHDQRYSHCHPLAPGILGHPREEPGS